MLVERKKKGQVLEICLIKERMKRHVSSLPTAAALVWRAGGWVGDLAQRASVGVLVRSAGAKRVAGVMVCCRSGSQGSYALSEHRFSHSNQNIST